jgi:hypothetical protein
MKGFKMPGCVTRLLQAQGSLETISIGRWNERPGASILFKSHWRLYLPEVVLSFPWSL